MKLNLRRCCLGTYPTPTTKELRNNSFAMHLYLTSRPSLSSPSFQRISLNQRLRQMPCDMVLSSLSTNGSNTDSDLSFGQSMLIPTLNTQLIFLYQGLTHKSRKFAISSGPSRSTLQPVFISANLHRKSDLTSASARKRVSSDSNAWSWAFLRPQRSWTRSFA